MMKRACLLFGLLLTGCLGGESETSDAGSSVATLIFIVPPPKTVAPGCPSPAVRLYVDGVMRSCPIATFEPNDGGAATTLISCNESKGLQPGVGYLLEAVYLQDSKIIARGALSSEAITLSAGSNRRDLPPANVTTMLDANSNGTSDIHEACP